MNEAIASIAPPPGLAKYFYWIAGYSISVCSLYLWGYWSVFDINFLQYTDIIAILKLAAFPFLVSAASLLLGVVFGHLMFGEEPTEEERVAMRNSRFGRILRKYINGISSVWVIATVLTWLFGSSEKWHFLPLFISLPIVIILQRRNFAIEVIPKQSIRNGLIFLAVYAVPFAYAGGLRDAQKIEAGVKFSYLLSPVTGVEVAKNATPLTRPRFLGQINDLIFLYSPKEKSVSITKFDEQKILTVGRYSPPPASSVISAWFSGVNSAITNRE